MKSIFLTVAFLFAITTLYAQEIVVELPPFSVSSHSKIEVEKVVLNDTATILHMVYFYENGGWMRIDSKTYIHANGQKYIVKRASGIDLDKETYGNETGKVSFSLIFPAIDFKTKTIDFIESDCDNCFKIWGIDLQSKTLANRIVIPQSIKNAALVKEDNQTLPVPQLKVGDAILKGRLFGYLPEMKFQGKVYVDNPVTGSQEEYSISLNDDGSFKTIIPLVSSSMQVLFSISPIYNSYILLSPGKETGVYFDLQQKSRQASKLRIDQCKKGKYIYFTGANAEINNQIEDLDFAGLYGSTFDYYNMQKEIVGMSSQQFKSYILNKLDGGIAALSKQGYTKKALEYAKLNLRFSAIYKLMFADYTLEEAFRSANNLQRNEPLKGFKKPVMDKAYYSFLKELSVNNFKSLYSSYFGNTINSCKYINRKVVSFNNITPSMLEILIESGKLSSQEIKCAQNISANSVENWPKELLQLHKDAFLKVAQNIMDSIQLNEEQTSLVQNLKNGSLEPGKTYWDLMEMYYAIKYNFMQSGNLNNNEILNLKIDEKSYEERFAVKDASVSSDDKKAFLEKYNADINIIIQKEKENELLNYVATIFEEKEGPVFDMIITQLYSRGFEEYTPMESWQLDKTAKIKTPFYHSYLSKKNKDLIDKIENNKNKEGVNVHEISKEVAGDDIMKSMLEKFKDKVVFIDFWATWCGPCRSAMKQFESAKMQFKGKDVVFVYLTGETSPEKTWKNMIPDIPGEHFRLTEAQWNELCKRSNVTGFPSYMILNKNGGQIYFNTGFEGVETLTSKINAAL